MFSESLLAWFDKNQRTLPWRTSPPNPYHTWLSEIMLQQTTVVTVIPYFQAFLRRWPTLQALADASLDEILVAWQGLGYYSRARNLHKCAQYLSQNFPSTEDELVKLPGIGPYTAAAIASIAFEQKAAAVDGNVIRVLSRYFALTQVAPHQDITKRLRRLLPSQRFGDFTQSLMELGALVCRPKAPACSLCPLRNQCQAHAQGNVEAFPVKAPKKKLPTRYTTAFVMRREDGAVFLRKRPSKGLLAGMMEVPSTPWGEKSSPSQGVPVRHTFTHFHLEVDVLSPPYKDIGEGFWVHPKDFKEYALPTLTKKILKSTFSLPNEGK